MYLQWPPPVLATMTEYIKLQKHISSDRIHISKDRNKYPIRTDRNVYPMTETYIKWKKHISYDRNHLSNYKKIYQMTIYIYQMTETYILWQTKYLSPPGQNIWTPCQNVSGYTYTLYPDSMSLTLWEDISILIVQLSNWKQH